MIQSPAGYQGDVRIKRYLDFYQAGYGVAMLSSGTTAFTPASLFAASEPGGWYDPSDLSTLYQDAAGTTPVTAVEQPVGLVLDKSRGLVLGSELVTNGDFSNGSTGWAVSAQCSISGGTARIVSSDGTFQNVSQNRTLTGPAWYELSVDIVSVSAGALIFAFTGAGVSIGLGGTTGTKKARFYVASNTSSSFSFGRSGVTDLTIDNISVRELPGSHLSQSTAAARPVLSSRVNLLTYTEQFDNAVWRKNNVSTTANTTATTDPLGGNTADVLSELAVTNFHFLDLLTALPFAATQYTFTACLKQGSSRYGGIHINDGTARGCSIDLQTGTLGTPYGSATATVADVGNGWYRLTVTATASATASGQVAIYVSNSNSLASYAGNTNNNIYIWGADLRPANAGVGLPAYQRVGAATDYDTTGFPLYLRADGTDDRLIGPAISNLISASAYEACIGARVLAVSTSNASPWLNQSLMADASGYVGVGYMTTSNIIGAFNYDGTSDTATQSMAPPSTFVLQQRHDGGNLVLSLNGGAEASTASGNTTNLTAETRVFSSNGSNSVQAHLYGLVIRSTAFTATERANLRTWMNEKAKAF